MTARQIGLLVLLGAIWGAAFMFIKIILTDVQPATLVAVRIAITALILYITMRATGVTLPRDRQAWKDFFIIGMVGLVIPFLLIGWGQRFIPSSLTSILSATTPLFTAIVNLALRHDDKINPERLIGLLIGFAGVLIAIGLDTAAKGNIWAEVCVLGAAVCYAFSALFARSAFAGMNPIVPSTGQMIASTAVLIPIALVWNGVPTVMPSTTSIVSMLVLSVVCTAAAYIIYYRIIADVGATKTSMVSYLIAPFGVIYGAIGLHETIAPNAVTGLIVIFAGILIAGGSWRTLLPKRA